MIKKAQTISQDETTAAIDDAMALTKSRVAALYGTEIENVSGGSAADVLRKIIIFGGDLLGLDTK